MQKWCKNLHKICPFREMVILRKPCFYYSKSKVFEVQRVQKSMRNRSENHAKTRFEKTMQKWSKMMPKWNQNRFQINQKGCQKSMRKSMRKSMQNGTLKRRVGGPGVSPLSNTQSPYLVLVFSVSYQPPTKPSKRPVGTATRMRGRIYVASDNRPRILCLVYQKRQKRI